MTLFKINCSFVLLFVGPFNIYHFEAKFNALSITVETPLPYVMKAPVPTAKAVVQKRKEKTFQRISMHEESQFLPVENLVYDELGTEPTFRVLRTSPAYHSYALKSRRIRSVFLHFSGQELF